MTTINDLERLLKSFINAAGYDVEEDRKVEGEKFYIVSKKKRLVKEKIANEDFVTFWNLYPKKTRKPKAIIAFKKITKSEFLLIKHDLAIRYINTKEQYVPKPSDYLNNKVWTEKIYEQNYREQTNKSNAQRVSDVLDQIGRGC